MLGCGIDARSSAGARSCRESKSCSQRRTAMHLKMLLSVVAAASFAAAPALAQEPTGTLKKIKDTGTVTLGHRESSVPFYYYGDKTQVVGSEIDLCWRLGRRLT